MMFTRFLIAICIALFCSTNVFCESIIQVFGNSSDYEDISTQNDQIKCYQCNSIKDNQTICMSNGDPDKLERFLKTCPQRNGKNAVGCWKQQFQIPYNNNGTSGIKTDRTVRTCAYTIPDDGRDCSHQSEFGTTSNECFCSKNACNNSTKLENFNLFSILFSLFTTIILLLSHK